MGRHRRSKKWAKKLAKRRAQERRRDARCAVAVLAALQAPESPPDWHYSGTVTGRMSCRQPNLNSLPRDAAQRSLEHLDFSQIELRVLAGLGLSGSPGGGLKGAHAGVLIADEVQGGK